MNPPLLVHFLDKTGRADVAEAMPRIVNALARQLYEHVVPTWGRVVPALRFGGEVPRGASPILIMNSPEEDGYLGYHDESIVGVPYGRVFLDPIEKSGGTLLFGANSLSVTMSHELLELVGDPSVNLWADGGDGFTYALELCDAVEGDAYEIDGVFVSNFVFPGFFDPQGAADVRLDYLRKLSKPFGMTPGGYQLRRSEGGKTEDVWGEAYPEWKKELKKKLGARMAKRAAR